MTNEESILQLIYHIKGYLDTDIPAYQHCYFHREDLEIIIKALEAIEKEEQNERMETNN